ncbi:Methanol oxidation protein MoxJ [Granulibacter bethesdensis]|nr:Methanol oxidation protein MoxJ [Granulibacter bethesdensis]
MLRRIRILERAMRRVMTGRLRFLAAVSTFLAFCAAHAPAFAQYDVDLVSRSAFRVCADPSDMPFSNKKRDGFENKIATLLAKTLSLPVSYTWFPQTVGFLRNTLIAEKCDVVIGVVPGNGMMDSTSAYYHSAYMIVTRQEDHLTATSVTDPSLAGKRFGLIAATPPSDLLLHAHLIDRATAYSLQVDTRVESPPRQMLQDLLDHKIDVALIWGPFAGYFIAEGKLPLHMDFLQSDGKVRLDYRVALGVRPNETEWRRRLNAALRKNQPAIDDILMAYHVPLLDEQNHPIIPKAASAAH